ncbi:MAG: glycoside hydrolase N-terminal domain-containing protein [Treponemataceae bacterium]|nr:glycoside hydrolase N-terminal domain-containing protein [Treponemataceae bacterium]
MDYSLWYEQPASDWNEAVPLGNGRLGMMMYGLPGFEKLQINEDSVWSGFFRDRNNPEAKEALSEVRKLLTDGEIRRAQKKVQESFSALPCNERSFQTAGYFNISCNTDSNAGYCGDYPVTEVPVGGEKGSSVKQYKRTLDVSTAVATVEFDSDGIHYFREYYISAPDDVMVIKLTADKKGSVNFAANFDRSIWEDGKGKIDNRTVFIDDAHGIPFCAMARAVVDGGTVRTAGQFLIVENADTAIIFVDIRTAFRESDFKATCLKKLDELAAKFDSCKGTDSKAFSAVYDSIKAQHIADYQKYFNRMSFELGDGASDASCVVSEAETSDVRGESKTNVTSADTAALPTDKRLEAFKQKPDDLDLVRLYADFGRYLLISSSRPGTLPANLQGIWCWKMESDWGSKYTININTEMNYWPANCCNLSEMEEPLFDLMERMLSNGKVTAQKMYGCRGFVAHHNTDIWGDCAPQDLWMPASWWVLGGAWLATHIVAHYEYTQDKDFLRRMYPVLHESCLFFADFLTEGTETLPDLPRNANSADESCATTCAAARKNLTVSPSSSPENTYRLPNGQTGSLCPGCEMDNRILEQLFKGTLYAAAQLGNEVPSAYAAAVEKDMPLFSEILSRLLPPVIQSNGTLREWNGEFEEVEPGHRHISHLYGLFPGCTISKDETPELAEAARKTLEHRLSHGGGHTGWSRAWIINFYASLGDGGKSWENVQALLAKSTLGNLFDNHPPFQIDGNFGGLAGIIRMLVQSRVRNGEVVVEFLPALPAAWKNGSLRGVALCGNLEADLSWKDGKVTDWKIRPKSADCSVRSKSNVDEKPCEKHVSEVTLVIPGKTLKYEVR